MCFHRIDESIWSPRCIPDARFCVWSGLLNLRLLHVIHRVGCHRRFVCALVAGAGVGLHGHTSLASAEIDERIEVTSDHPIGDQAGSSRVVLSNGLELIVIEDSASAGSDVQMWLILRAGSMYERDDERGAAKVLERIVRRGTTRFDAQAIDELLMKQSNGNGSFVSFDQTGYLAQVDLKTDRSIENAIRFFGDIVGLNPELVSDADFESAIADVQKEISNETSAEMRSRQRWLPVLMEGTWFGDRLPTPSLDELSSLTAAGVRRFAREHYRPGQAVLIVYGGVDASAIQAMVTEQMGMHASSRMNGLDEHSRGNPQALGDTIDARLGASMSQRYVLGTDPGFETHQNAMIWFEDRDDSCIGSWSDRAQRYSLNEMRTHLIDRVAGEVLEYRLDRLIAGELGLEAQVSVEQIDLFGQVDLLQIAVESQDVTNDSWARSMTYLVRECDRLFRDGASEHEIVRARGALLARWHREANDWAHRDTQSKMGLMHWLITTGRPIMDIGTWDERATRLMVDISDDEVERTIQRLIEPSLAAYLTLMSDEMAKSNQLVGGDQNSTSLRNGVIQDVVKSAMSSAIDSIDPEWMETIAGPLFEQDSSILIDPGVVEEVIEHPASGVVGVKLKNGIEIWSRGVGDGEVDEINLSATVWGGVLSTGGGREMQTERVVQAALSAWRMPATESRSGGAVSTFIREHGLSVSVSREAGYVQLGVRGPTSSLSEAAQLMYVLLDQPMIERDAFESWLIRLERDGVDPLEQALGKMYGSDEGLTKTDRVSIDDAQRMLTQMVRSGRVDIGIAGPMDASDMIEQVSGLFGLLVEREGVVAKGIPVQENQLGMTHRRLAQMSGFDEREHGVTLGYVSNKPVDLSSLRGLFLGAMVLNDRIDQLEDEQGIEIPIRAQVGFSDAIPDRVMLIVRSRCEESAYETVIDLIDEAIGSVVRDGVDEDELIGVQDRIERSINQYFDSPSYWSARLSMLGVHARSVDDLWTIRQGYHALDSEMVSHVFGELVSSRDQFRVEIKP